MERELQKTFIEQNITPAGDMIRQHFRDFEEFMMIYGCAIREVRTKFEVLNDDLSVANKRNPIEMIKSRVKKPESIVGKLRRRNLELSMESVIENIHDVAGVRVICSFVNDIYAIAQMFTSQDDVRVIEVKDYIKNPKPNGYRSYHMIVEVPVFFANRKQNVKVEVQLRTIAMDFWASLEHKIHYKFEGDAPENIKNELVECARMVSDLDARMLSLNEEILAISKKQEEEKRQNA